MKGYGRVRMEERMCEVGTPQRILYGCVGRDGKK